MPMHGCEALRLVETFFRRPPFRTDAMLDHELDRASLPPVTLNAGHPAR